MTLGNALGQTAVNTVPAPAFEGDFCDSNPRYTYDAGPGGLVAGSAGLTVGRFAWATYPPDADNAPSVANNNGVGPVAGFVHREQQGLITTYLQTSSMLVPAGFPVITAFGWASPQEIDDIMALAIRVNDFLSGLFLGAGIQLVDFKIECGRLWENEMMRIVVADEISPDSCRLWDVQTQDKLDKDRFRRDMGGLLEAYTEVAKRLGILIEQERPKGGGPVLVQ